jgi:hypothetical protein
MAFIMQARNMTDFVGVGIARIIWCFGLALHLLLMLHFIYRLLTRVYSKVFRKAGALKLRTSPVPWAAGLQAADDDEAYAANDSDADSEVDPRGPGGLDELLHQATSFRRDLPFFLRA